VRERTTSIAAFVKHARTRSSAAFSTVCGTDGATVARSRSTATSAAAVAVAMACAASGDEDRYELPLMEL
jgi:hypothetical protein